MTCDLWEFVIVEDPSRCVAAVAAVAAEASEIENQAMRDDRHGEALEAAMGYRKAAAKLREAADVCPEALPDRQVLEQHAIEVLSRATYLDSLKGARAALPLQEHIHAVELTLGRPARREGGGHQGGGVSEGGCITAGHSSSMKSRLPLSESKVMGAAAVISGSAGLLVLGPFAGVALGAATAYATTREDQAGSAARKVGVLGVGLVDQAKTLNREHRIVPRVASVTAYTKKELSNLAKSHRVSEKVTWGISSAGRAGLCLSRMVTGGR
jgi:hypothetical protein